MLNAVQEYIRDGYPDVDTAALDNEDHDEERMAREENERREEEERYGRYLREGTELEEQRANREELVRILDGQVQNDNQGAGFKVCDMERLKRFIILGSEFNTYYCSSKKILMESVQCVTKLINDNHYQEVLDTIEQYAKEGRAAKEEPLLTVLAICAVNDRMEVKKAAYEKVNSICNIPTKLFKFIDLTHDDIVRKRIASPPEPQLCTSSTRKRKQPQSNPELGISELTLSEKKEPSENVDETQVPRKKKKGKEFKKVNKVAARSLGWGRMRRHGVGNFYTDDQKDACRLLYLLTKYRQRNNWSHKQVLQYAHPKMTGEDHAAKNLVLRYCTRGYNKVAKEIKQLGAKPGLSEQMSEVIAYIEVINAVMNLSPETEGDEEKLIQHLQNYGRRPEAKEFTTQHSFEGSARKENTSGRKSPIQIVREHIPTGFLKSRKVWELMLLDMPMTAMIRNLGKMSSLGMFENNSTNTNIVLSALDNEKRLQSAKVHPVKLLIAAQTYQRGSGEKGKLKWKVNMDIIKSLNAAFYKSFKSPEIGKTFRTNKKYLLALDVSGSMQGEGCLGCESLTPALATAAMSMVTWNIEDDVEIMGFGGHFVDLKPLLQKSMTVQAAMKTIGKLNFGATDCSLPMIFALTEKKEIDVFIVYTDCETDFDTWQPMDALRIYNSIMKRDAKLIVCGMTSAGFTIADPNCPNALDICGFDANVPEIINDFVTGNQNMKCDVCDDCKKSQQ